MIVVIPVVWLATMFAARYFPPLPTILIASVALAVVVAVKDHRRMRELMRLTPHIAILSIASAAVMVATTYVLFPLLVRAVPLVRVAASAIYANVLATRSLPLTLAGVIPVVIAEELLWRGRFQEDAGRWTLVITPLVYAAAHIPLGSWLLVAVAFVCGAYWSLLRGYSRSLMPSLCAHIAWDIALILVPLVR